MYKILFPCIFVFSTFVGWTQTPADDAATVKSIYSYALTHSQGYQWLEELTNIGGRLSGSEEADEAVQRFKAIADSMGFTTQLQEVTVPHWVRGSKEVAFATAAGENHYFQVCALGGSVGTPFNGITAPVVEINSFDQLQDMDSKALKGKIAFYNIPMDPSFINTFFAYSQSVKQRYVGALEASKKGAIAVVIRSLSATVNPYPHTGSMTYVGAPKHIPAAAISTQDAEWLTKALQTHPELKITLKMDCELRDSVTSHNLIADLKGSEKPDEIILIGGHIDSWDLGTGAHDDGAGCMHALEAAWLLKELNLLPKRTLRVVFFMNEEFGLNGAKTYAKFSKQNKLHHVLALESDAGGFSPRGISIDAPDTIVNRIKLLRELLEPYGIHQFSQQGSGADIGPLKNNQLVLIGMRPDNQRYFEIHHSALDVLGSVNPRELEMGSATLASLVYLLDKLNVVIGE